MTELTSTACGIRVLMMHRADRTGMTLDTGNVGSGVDDVDNRSVGAGVTGGTGVAVRINNLGKVGSRVTG